MTLYFFPTRPALLLLTALLTCAACTKESPKIALAIGKPVFASVGAPAPHLITEFDIAVRAPSIPAWSASLRKDPSGSWRVVSRSEQKTIENGGELADTKLVAHLLEILSTFATEAEAGPGNDAAFGFSPYRLEIRYGSATQKKLLLLGDPTGPNSIYFRVNDSNSTWIGRGALIAFLPTIESPDAFIQKRPFAMVDDEVRELEIEKADPAGVWRFKREQGSWKQSTGGALTNEKSAILERLFRQRITKTVSEGRLALDKPDWVLTYRSASAEEHLTISFELDRILGRNPARTSETLEFYPELAGTLRAFTQARFSPLKSTSK
jgi:hypothetical protein